MQLFSQLFYFKMQSFFDKISDWLPPIFTKPSNTFSVAFQKVSEGFVARIPKEGYESFKRMSQRSVLGGYDSSCSDMLYLIPVVSCICCCHFS